MAHLRATVLSNRWDKFRASYDRTTQTYQLAA